MTYHSAVDTNAARDEYDDTSAPRLDIFGSRGETVQSASLTDDILTIGQAPSNQVVLSGDGVGRFHVRITRQGDQVIVTDLGSRGGTQINDSPLTPNTPRAWPMGSTMRIGQYRIRLTDPRTQQGQNQPLAAAVPVAAAAALSSKPNGIDIAIDGGRSTLELNPGQTELAVLILSNRQAFEEVRTLAVEGIPASWLNLPNRELSVPANGQISVPIKIIVPKEASARAGLYNVILKAISPQDPELFSSVEASWTVQPFPGVALELKPRKQSVRGIRPASYIAIVQNAGNEAETFSLRAGNDQPGLDYQFDRTRFTIEPGASERVTLMVQPQENPTNKVQNYSFSVYAQAGDGPETLESAQLIQSAPRPAWILPVAIAIPLLLVAGMFFLLNNAKATQASANEYDLSNATPVSATPGLIPSPTFDDALAISLPEPTKDESRSKDEEEQQSIKDAAADAVSSSVEQMQTQVAQVVLFANGGAPLTSNGVASAGNTNGSGGANGGNGSNGSNGSNDDSSGNGSSGNGSKDEDEDPTATTAPTNTPTYTPSATPTPTLTPTPTITPTPTQTQVVLPPGTSTPTPTFTVTPTPSITPTPSNTPTNTPTASPTFTPTPLPAKKLAFLDVPGSAIAGKTMSQIAVQVQDEKGNVVKTKTGDLIKIEINAGNCTDATLFSTATLTGTISVPVNAEGSAIFTDLRIDCAGTGFILRASSQEGNLVQALSNPAFQVVKGQAAALRYLTEPEDTVADEKIKDENNGDIIVAVVDAGGNIVDGCNNKQLKMTKSGGHASATVSGDTATVQNGKATFNNLSMAYVGLDYRLIGDVQNDNAGSCNNIATQQSSAFNITANQLEFYSEVTSKAAGASLGSIKVRAVDDFSTTDTTFDGTIKLSLSGGNPAATITVPNGESLEKKAVQGVATFSSSLSIAKIGQDYQIHAKDKDNKFDMLDGAKFNITANQLRIIGGTKTINNIKAGTSFAPTETVRVQATDDEGTEDTTYKQQIKLNLAFPSGTIVSVSDQNGFELTKTPTGNGAVGDGTVVFDLSDIQKKIKWTDADYRFIASSGSLTNAATDPFNVTANKLFFKQQPSSNSFKSNEAVGTVIIAATDEFNTVDATFDNSQLDLDVDSPGSIVDGFGPGKSGADKTTPPDGLAIPGQRKFTITSFPTADDGYKFIAKDLSTAGLADVASNDFKITASKLVFLEDEVKNTPAGAYITDKNGFNLKVAATGEDGNPDPNFSTAIKITTNKGTLQDNGADKTSVSRTPLSGVSTFDKLGIKNVGQNVKLTANVDGLASASTQEFNITANRYAFVVQPTTRKAMEPFSQIKVIATDSSNSNEEDKTLNTTLTLSINNGGILSVTDFPVINGVALINGLYVENLRSEYKLTAEAVPSLGIVKGESATFSITANKLRFLDKTIEIYPANNNYNFEYRFTLQVQATDDAGHVDNFTSYNIELLAQPNTHFHRNSTITKTRTPEPWNGNSYLEFGGLFVNGDSGDGSTDPVQGVEYKVCAQTTDHSIEVPAADCATITYPN
ncbi:FHA domain-containing protein [Chloroflexia bacterium SDU3-3]|nr:FHA domain-containing protein [Chloroflexia bacterium SDU3-3]